METLYPWIGHILKLNKIKGQDFSPKLSWLLLLHRKAKTKSWWFPSHQVDSYCYLFLFCLPFEILAFPLNIDMKQKSLTWQETETIYVVLSLWFKTYIGLCIQAVVFNQDGFCHASHSPKDIWQYLKTFWLSWLGGRGATGIQWVEARDAAKNSIMHRIPPTTTIKSIYSKTSIVMRLRHPFSRKLPPINLLQNLAWALYPF